MAADSVTEPNLTGPNLTGPNLAGRICGHPSALRVLRARGRVRGGAALLGPAFVAAVAYIDPGNFATNFSAGAVSGYELAWAIVVANLMAMLVQYLSAKVGVATGRDLPELCRDHLPRVGLARPVAPGRARRHGHRPGGIRRRRDRAQPAVRRAAAAGRADHRRRRVRDPRARAARLPAVRDRHRRPARDRLPRLRLRPGRRGSLASRNRGRARAQPRRPGQPAAGDRNRRRHRHAARRLPALGPDEVAGVVPRQRRAPRAARLPAARRHGRARRGRSDQSRDAASSLPRCSTGAGRRGRTRSSRRMPDSPGWSAAARRWPSRSPCSRPGSRRPAWAPTPARW